MEWMCLASLPEFSFTINKRRNHEYLNIKKTRNPAVNVENLDWESIYVSPGFCTLHISPHEKRLLKLVSVSNLKIQNLISVACVKLFNFNFSENARSQRFFWRSPQQCFVSVNSIPALSQVLTLS